MLLGFGDAAERLGDQVAFKRVEFRRGGGRVAGCDGKGVDKFEDEEAREGAAEVADAVNWLARVVEIVGCERTYVARRVM